MGGQESQVKIPPTSAQAVQSLCNNFFKIKELRADFQAAVDHYLADCAATGRQPLKAASGRMMLRISPEVHARALARAQSSGRSLNQWAEEVLDQAART